MVSCSVFSLPWNSSMFHPFICFSAPPTIDLLTVSNVLPFSEYHILIVGIILSVAISDWHLSPSSRHLRFFHVLPWLDSSVVFSSELYSFIWMFSSVAQLCLTICDPMDCSTRGFPVIHPLPELTQTHVHWVGDAIQPSHSLSSPSPAFSLSQHQGLFQWVSSLHQVAIVLELQL